MSHGCERWALLRRRTVRPLGLKIFRKPTRNDQPRGFRLAKQFQGKRES
jgi:hypothetical protein